MGRRGTSNTNCRGSAANRRNRKLWLLTKFGDGHTAKCLLALSPKCLVWVTFETLWVDRHPIPGHEGGTYRRDNIRPACQHCQELQGGMIALSNGSLDRAREARNGRRSA